MYATKFSVLMLAGLVAGAAPAAAQGSASRTETAAPGDSVRILVASNLKDDCSAGAMPELRINTSPKNGVLIIKVGKLKTPASHKCPNKEAAVLAAFYQSKDGFSGSDDVAIEVKKADGKTTTQSVTVNVSGTAKKSDAKKDATDL